MALVPATGYTGLTIQLLSSALGRRERTKSSYWYFKKTIRYAQILLAQRADEGGDLPAIR
jgi:hypothetical protein